MEVVDFIIKNKDIAIILMVVCFIVALVLAIREFLASNKRKQIADIRAQIYKPLSKNTGVKDAVAMGAASVGITIFDIYATMHNHEEVLDVLEQRFPEANGANDMWDWFNKISEMFERNTSSLDSYVSCFKGQVAENIALQMLKDKGMDAELFDSLTNADNDIFVSLRSGKEAYYSVKCGDVDYIKECIRESDATRYIINSESYNELESQGMIDLYEKNGIEIIDGNYSDLELTNMAENAFEDIHEVGDVSDSIPYVALALLGIKTFNNVKQYAAGKQTEYETISNVGMDILKVGGAGVFASVGSEVGAYIGTMILPGVGTVIGAGIGVVGFAIMGNSLVEWGKEKIKWGKIIAAQDYFGEKYKEGYHYVFCDNVINRDLEVEEIYNSLCVEEKLLEEYKDEMNPYKRKKATVQAVLADEYFQSMKIIKKRIEKTKSVLIGNMKKVCTDSVSKMDETKREKFARRLLGELIIGNADCMGSMTNEEQMLLQGYNYQKNIAGNYPYQFSENPKSVMQTIVKQTFNDAQISVNKHETKRAISILLIILFMTSGIGIGVITATATTIDTTQKNESQWECEKEDEEMTRSQVETETDIKVETKVETKGETKIAIEVETKAEAETRTEIETESKTEIETASSVVFVREMPESIYEIEGINMALLEEIKQIDMNVIDYYRINEEKYNAKGFYYLGKIGVNRSVYNSITGYNYFVQDIIQEDVYSNKKFMYVKYFFHQSGTNGKIVSTVFSRDFSSKLSGDSTYDELMQVMGKGSYRVSGMDNNGYGIGYFIGECHIFFKFDKNNRICDYVYVSVSPSVIE